MHLSNTFTPMHRHDLIYNRLQMVLYMEGQDPPTQVIEINDPDIPQYPIIIAPETALDVPADPEGPTKV